MTHEGDLKRVIDFFESLSADSVDALGTIYTEEAYFKDPFNEVHGLAAIQSIFRHMFVQVDDPGFVITTHMVQASEAFLTWDFLFSAKRLSKSEVCIRGATHLRFGTDGRVAYHRDYWDVAEELYEKLPLVGTLMRVLKKAAK